MNPLKANDPERARRYFEERLAFTTGPAELSTAMREGTVRVVDVRAKKDFDAAHVPGSVNLPAGTWDSEQGLSREQLNVVLCYSATCLLAARAAVTFAAKGYPVMELHGGFAGWKEHGLPVEQGTDASSPLERAHAYLESARETAEATREEPSPRAKNHEPPPKDEKPARKDEGTADETSDEKAATKDDEKTEGGEAKDVQGPRKVERAEGQSAPDAGGGALRKRAS